MKEPAFYDRLAHALLADAGIGAVVEPPKGVEAFVREGEGRRILFLINHTETHANVNVPAGREELLSGKRTIESLDLGPYGVALIRLQ
jgi:beta-galactosidase